MFVGELFWIGQVGFKIGGCSPCRLEGRKNGKAKVTSWSSARNREYLSSGYFSSLHRSVSQPPTLASHPRGRVYEQSTQCSRVFAFLPSVSRRFDELVAASVHEQRNIRRQYPGCAHGETQHSIHVYILRTNAMFRLEKEILRKSGVCKSLVSR